jgi:hypothetical protein
VLRPTHAVACVRSLAVAHALACTRTRARTHARAHALTHSLALLSRIRHWRNPNREKHPTIFQAKVRARHNRATSRVFKPPPPLVLPMLGRSFAPHATSIFPLRCPRTGWRGLCACLRRRCCGRSRPASDSCCFWTCTVRAHARACAVLCILGLHARARSAASRRIRGDERAVPVVACACCLAPERKVCTYPTCRAEACTVRLRHQYNTQGQRIVHARRKRQRRLCAVALSVTIAVLQ